MKNTYGDKREISKTKLSVPSAMGGALGSDRLRSVWKHPCWLAFLVQTALPPGLLAHQSSNPASELANKTHSPMVVRL